MNARMLGLLLTAGFGLIGSAVAQTITNPIAPNGADPWVIQKDGVYHYCYSRDNAIWINSSKSLQDAAQFEGEKIWAPDPNTPYSKELWAPELHFLDGKWYVYVAADDGNNFNHRMVVLESETADPHSPYSFKGKIADATDKWSIDGTPLKQNGKLYFVWSGWEGDENIQQNLYIAAMSDPKTICGPRVLISAPELDWERLIEPQPAPVPYVNEGPQILQHNGETFIIYSAGGSWTDDYGLGQLKLTGNDPLAPDCWTKKRTKVFGSSGTVFSPGHASFTQSPDGTEDWILYHSAKHKGAMWNRDVNLKKFTWDINDNPVFGYPESKGIPFPAPAE